MHNKCFNEYTCVYDENNNLIKVFENEILTNKYTYNKQNKITREDNLLLNCSITYVYNQFGNIIERKIHKYSTTKLKDVVSKDIFEYSSIQPNVLIKYNDETFKYNKHKLPVIFRNAKLKWTKYQNLKSIDEFAGFEYFKNVRKSKTIGNKTTIFKHLKGKIVAQNDGQYINFIYYNHEIIGFNCKYCNTLQKFLFKKNFNGDVVGIYNCKHELICKYVYDYFGNHKILINENNNFLDQELLTSNHQTNYFSFIANLNPIRFHGNYFDNEIGLYYLNNHYYDPETIRYLN